MELSCKRFGKICVTRCGCCENPPASLPSQSSLSPSALVPTPPCSVSSRAFSWRRFLTVIPIVSLSSGRTISISSGGRLAFLSPLAKDWQTQRPPIPANGGSAMAALRFKQPCTVSNISLARESPPASSTRWTSSCPSVGIFLRRKISAVARPLRSSATNSGEIASAAIRKH